MNKTEYIRPSIAREKHIKLSKFVLEKYGTLHHKLCDELGKAVDEYVERHGGDKCKSGVLKVV